MSTREEDFVKEIHLADTHTKLLVFSSLGKVYSLRSHDIPVASLKARGKPIVNLLPFSLINATKDWLFKLPNLTTDHRSYFKSLG